MIGKLYRPSKIEGLRNPYGFRIHHKLVSYFKGELHFYQDVYAIPIPNKEEQTIYLDFSMMEVPILLDVNEFKPLSKKKAIDSIEKPVKRAGHLRPLRRPQAKKKKSAYFTKNPTHMLVIEIEVGSDRGEEEAEVLEFKMIPTAYNDQEYLHVTATAESRIQIISDNVIHFDSKEFPEEEFIL